MVIVVATSANSGNQVQGSVANSSQHHTKAIGQTVVHPLHLRRRLLPYLGILGFYLPALFEVASSNLKEVAFCSQVKDCILEQPAKAFSEELQHSVCVGRFTAANYEAIVSVAALDRKHFACGVQCG